MMQRIQLTKATVGTNVATMHDTTNATDNTTVRGNAATMHDATKCNQQ